MPDTVVEARSTACRSDTATESAREDMETDMTAWKKQYAERFAALLQEAKDGVGFELSLIPAHCLDEVMADGDAGDELARQIVNSINAWAEMTQAAAKDGQWPGCVSCGDQVRRGDVCGWVIFLPSQRGSTGMVGAFCEECYKLGP